MAYEGPPEYEHNLSEGAVLRHITECERAIVVAVITVFVCTFLSVVALACAITP